MNIYDRATVMNDEEWERWSSVVKCDWRTCYAGHGLAGNGICFASGDFKDPKCPQYKTEDEWIKERKEIKDNEVPAL